MSILNVQQALKAAGYDPEALGVPAISFVGGLVMTFFGEQVLRLFR